MTTEQRRTIIQQIGNMNVAAISGGRVMPIEDGIEMPVSNGYRVRVRYDEGMDTYTVQRVFVRAGREFPKGEHTNVYCDEVGEVAYRASSFRSYGDGEW